MKQKIEKLGILIIVLIIGAFLGYAYTLIKSESKEKTVPSQKKTTVILDKALHSSSNAIVRLLDLDEAHTLFTSGKAVFLDARPEQDYNYMHIPGAISAPYMTIKENPAILSMDKNQLIVVYCSSSTCPMAEIAATRLNELLFQRIFIFSGGLKDWYEAKYPLERGQ